MNTSNTAIDASIRHPFMVTFYVGRHENTNIIYSTDADTAIEVVRREWTNDGFRVRIVKCELVNGMPSH